MAYCIKCGVELKDGSRFCSGCGQIINTNVYNPPQQYPQQQLVISQAPQPYNGVGTAGFVLALIGLFIFWIPVIGWILPVLGVILSFVGLFFKPKGLAIAGFIISLISIVLITTIVKLFSDLFSSFNYFNL